MPTLVGESRSAFGGSKSAKNLIDRADFRPRPRILPMDLRQCESAVSLEKTRKGTMGPGFGGERKETRRNRERKREKERWDGPHRRFACFDRG